MKHFEEPLTALMHDDLLGTTSTSAACTLLAESPSFQFLDLLVSRLRANAPAAAWLDSSFSALLDGVHEARDAFYTKARRMRRAYRMVRRVQTWMIEQGYKSAENSGREGESGAFDLMGKVLRGKAGRDVKYLGTMIS
jgi:origin recognition complex subunit 3